MHALAAKLYRAKCRAGAEDCPNPIEPVGQAGGKHRVHMRIVKFCRLTCLAELVKHLI